MTHVVIAVMQGASPGTRRDLPTASSKEAGTNPNQPLSREAKDRLRVAEDPRGVTDVANISGKEGLLRECVRGEQRKCEENRGSAGLCETWCMAECPS